LKSKSLLILTLLSLAASFSHALDVEQIFGHAQPSFIHQYNERVLQWFLGRNPAIQKCVSAQDQKDLVKTLQNWSDWGDTYKIEKSPDRQLHLNFEVFYEQKGAGSKLSQGIRFRWPQQKTFSFRGTKWNENIWGAEIHSDSCRMSLLRRDRGAAGEFVVAENGERTVLQLAQGVKGDYYFGGLVTNSFPIYREQNLVGEILFLESYNLFLFGSEFFPIAVAHEKEFHQMALRFKWKSKDEYTVYYP